MGRETDLMKPIVLIVDDDANVAAAIRRLLHPEGYDVRVADSGAAALAVLNEADPAVIIADQRMPGMTGDQVLTEALRHRPDAYRISVTGYADLKAVQATINQGHVHHLLFKPWDDEHLLQVVREGVRRFELIRENRRLVEVTRQQKAELEQQNRTLAEQVQQRTAELQAQNRDLWHLRQRMAESLADMVNVLSALIEAGEPNVALHCKRVAELARRLGQQLHLDEVALRDLEFAARLHEIGQAGRRNRQITPCGRTTQARREELERRYTELGFTILSRVRGFETVALAVRHQRERFDGQGVPDGLRGEDIPLLARILAISDAYDQALYAHGHQARLSLELGRRVLAEGSGKAFDPALVQVLLTMLHSSTRNVTQANEIELPPNQVAVGMVLSRDLRNMHGVLVLRAGTHLTAEHLQHIRALSAADPLIGGVFVHCQPEQPAAASAATPPTVPTGTAPKRRILVVDDDELVRKALVRELRRAGWEITCAPDGRLAQNILEDNAFDVLLIDVAMPVMTGVALVAHVQQCWPDLPCVILTGHATREQLERLRQTPNVTAVLGKPWDSQRLLDALESAVGGRAAKAAHGAV